MSIKSYASHRSGTTLIELLIFLGVLGLVVSVAMPLLFSATENRILQQTIAVVEQNSAQAMQNITYSVRHAEEILLPLRGETGSVLALQTSSGATSPVIVGVNSGSIMIIEHTTSERLTSPQVAITDFSVRNTSTDDDQSVEVSFRASRTIRLQQPHSYARYYQFAASAFPADVPIGNACGCAVPSCQDATTFGWQVCEQSVCYAAEAQLLCD